MDSQVLADLLIVSQVRVTAGGALSVSVAEAGGEKCLRCWKHSADLGSDPEHPALCARCAAVVRDLPQF